MKIIFNIKRLVAVFCLLSATFAYSRFELPPLSTDDEKLAFLLQVRKEIPKLFVDAAKYDINLFTLLDNEAELVNLLKKYPRFDELYSAKKYLNMSVEPTGDIWVGEVEIKPEAIEAWKQSILEKIQIAQIDVLKPQDLLTVVNTKDILISDPLETLNKIGFIEGKGKAKTEQINKFKKQNIIVERCKSKKYSQLIEKFQCISENYGEIYDEINKLPHLPSKEDIDWIVTGLSQEEKVFPQLYLAAVLKKNPNTPVPQNWEEFKNSIEQLKGEDLIYLNDKDDVLRPILVTYFDGENVPRLVRALDFIHKEINKYASNSISHQTLVTSEVELVQVPPEIGIFRGCIGGDCSSQFSFPYPNDPHERVFYIKTKKLGGDLKEAKLKGYVSTTEVMVGAEKALYVITISGANVSAQDVELIFRGFEKAKETLGVKHIILPTLDNLAGLINFPAIKGAYENHIRKSNRSVELVYQDQAIRNEIEQYKPLSGYNKADYDNSYKNKNGLVLLIKNNNPVEVSITERSVLKDNIFSKEDLFEFIKELRISGRKVMIDRVLKTETTKKAFGEEGASIINRLFLLLDSCREPDVLNIQQFKININDRLINLGLGEDYLKSNPNLMVPGYFKCQDVFSNGNLEEAAMLVVNDIKNHEDKSSLFPLIKWHIVELNKTSAFGKLNKRYYDKLSNSDAEIRKTAIKIFINTRTEDPKIHKAIAKALGDPDAQVRINAAKALQNTMTEDLEIHKALAKALGDADRAVRINAAQALEMIKPTDQVVFLEIAKLLQHETANIRAEAADLLGKIKPEDPKIHRALAKALGDADWEVRKAAAQALKRVEPTVQETLLEITALLQHENSDIRTIAADVLTSIRSVDPEIHRALAKALGDADRAVRKEVARFLEIVKPTNQVALLEIVTLLKHENTDIRADAAHILGYIKPTNPEILFEIVALLKHETADIRNIAYNVLKEIKPTNQEVIFELVALLKHENKDIRAAAAHILGYINPTNQEVIFEIAELLKHEAAYVRADAAITLGYIKAAVPEIHRALTKILSDPDLSDPDGALRWSAMLALQEIKPTDREILLEIVALLKHETEYVRVHAHMVLKEIIKPTNQEILFEIAKLLQHENPDIRARAAMLLEQLQKNWKT